MMNNISLQLNKASMLSGHSLTFIPLLAMAYGYAESIVYLQLRFLASKNKYEPSKIRISYTKLQHTHFPFYSRRWVMETIARLEAGDFIAVHRTGRVNVFEVKPLPDKEFIDILPIYGHKKLAYEIPIKYSSIDAPMQVSVALASKIGLLEATIIQQIHLRHKGADGSHWVLRSFDDWHRNTFMFISPATIKRHFSKLAKSGLILVKKHVGDYGLVNCYRVNYIQVAEVLGVELPESVAPTPKYEWLKPEKWVSQLHPVKAKQKNEDTCDCVPLVH
jgi:hypothetical protein